MKKEVKMIFTGLKAEVSKKTQKGYYLANFLVDSGELVQMYVAGDRVELIKQIEVLKQLDSVIVQLELKAYRGKFEVELNGVAKA
jgi:hypothetical protein